jgi:hypothetical protein
MIFYLDDSIEMRWKRDQVSLEIADGSERRRVYLRSAEQLRSLASACIQAANKIGAIQIDNSTQFHREQMTRESRRIASEEAAEAFQ